VSLLLLPAVAAAGEEEDRRLAAIDRSMAKAATWLVSKQSPDGAWRSETYAVLRQGPALTPYVMSALWFLPRSGEAGEASYGRGVEYLARLWNEKGELDSGPYGLAYSVYTAASASRVVVLQDRSPRNLALQRRWFDLVRTRHLGRENGWTPADRSFGGWGYALSVPKKPGPDENRPPYLSSNLSATLFGVAALRSSKIPRDDPVWADVLVFVRRCQNYAGTKPDPRFDDGGFFFAPDDDVLNKAGIAGKDAAGRTRYRSYGSMTADGLRALLQCGLPPSHPRVVAARTWLTRNFRADRNPGRFVPDRENSRGGTYYYWVWSITHAFARLGLAKIERDGEPVDWAAAIADRVMKRQRRDGSWINAYSEAKEDDPLVATPWAASALAVCRTVLADPKRVSLEACRPEKR